EDLGKALENQRREKGVDLLILVLNPPWNIAVKDMPPLRHPARFLQTFPRSQCFLDLLYSDLSGCVEHLDLVRRAKQRERFAVALLQRGQQGSPEGLQVSA